MLNSPNYKSFATESPYAATSSPHKVQVNLNVGFEGKGIRPKCILSIAASAIKGKKIAADWEYYFMEVKRNWMN